MITLKFAVIIFYCVPLLSHLKILSNLSSIGRAVGRKIRNFNEDNWWQWGRGQYESSSDRIYVNCKTRDDKPFFINDSKFYDGTVFAIFPKVDIDIEKVKDFLNDVDWYELGFKVGGRLCFSQKSLENVYLSNKLKSFVL